MKKKHDSGSEASGSEQSGPEDDQPTASSGPASPKWNLRLIFFILHVLCIILLYFTYLPDSNLWLQKLIWCTMWSYSWRADFESECYHVVGTKRTSTYHTTYMIMKWNETTWKYHTCRAGRIWIWLGRSVGLGLGLKTALQGSFFIHISWDIWTAT